MKKSLLMLGFAALLLGACGSDEKASDEQGTQEEQGIEVDKGLANVELTLPATFFEGSTKEEIEANAGSDGIKEVKVNEDGSVYYKMSKSAHNEMLENAGEGIVETIDEMINSEDFTSFKEISYNKDFTEFDIKVNRESYENSFDGFGIFGLAFASAFYSALDGKNLDDARITMVLIDEATNEAYDTIVWPDDLETDEEETEVTE